MNKIIAAIFSIAAIALPQSAIAQSTPAVSRDSLGNLIIGNSGYAPGTLIRIDYPTAVKEKTFTTSGACNLLTVKRSSTFYIGNYIKIGDSQINASNEATPGITGLACVNGAINPAYPWITVGAYRYVQSTGNAGLQFIIAGATGSVLVTTNPGKERLGRTDSCGRVVIKNSEKWKVADLNDGTGTFGYTAGSDNWTILPLPAMETTSTPPYICYRKTLYKPLNP
ncbi:hypothetical protein [Microcoleus sp. herbarium5]|uniref:hypothetical protein n=1 Tax=Microcoleus sp. herbarium5 TaxID=3055434 RepID=UPI002FD4AF38